MSNSTPVPPRGGKGRNQRNRQQVQRGGQAQRGRPPQKGRQARQAQQRRTRALAYSAIGAVIVIIAVLVIVKAAGGGPSNGALRTPATAAEEQAITNVPLSALTGASDEVRSLTGATDANTTGVPKTLTTGGKPELLYIGAEFCPYCAAERWPMIIALSHFGTFTNLQTTHSGLSDGDVPTWSFYGASYSSPYLVFHPIENETNTRALLQTPTSAETQIWTTYFSGGESYPFIDFNQKFVIGTSQYSYAILEGSSFSDILSSVGSNDNTIGAAIDAAAAQFTKYLCNMTGDQPAATCSAVAKISAPVSTSTASGNSSAG